LSGNSYVGLRIWALFRLLSLPKRLHFDHYAAILTLVY